ncbi:MAG: ThaI family type II restriction endonuclease [bacterium]|nr:ThaI family type II restriction endonuclease [bacterium]
MKKSIESIFEDSKIVEKIKKKLLYLFQLAEIDNSRDGKLGMEVGSARERIVIALLIYKFGSEDVKTNIPITKAETDVILFNKPLSIKTASGKKINGVKLIWTVDPKKAIEFSKAYKPTCDTILVQINWGGMGYFYLLPKEVQEEVLKKIGRKKYIRLPKQGTNPRGVELSSAALDQLTKNPKIKKIEIFWKREEIKYNSYDRWVDYWNEE